MEENVEACLTFVQYQQNKHNDIRKACTCDDKKMVGGQLLSMLDQDNNSFHLSFESDKNSPRA